jgi:cysteine desulfuration protein SufE
MKITMNLAARQTEMIGRFSVIEDPHERLSAVVAFKPALAPLADSERTDANIVRGCVSRVWLGCSLENGRCRFRFHADSPLVRGLVGVLCALYDDSSPEEIIATEPEIFDALGISKNLTPTRLNGLASVRAAILKFAQSCIQP